MSFKVGDKVRIKKSRITAVCEDAHRHIGELDINGVFTINEIHIKDMVYIAKEFTRPWRWNYADLELVQFAELIFEPIYSRFEILDL